MPSSDHGHRPAGGPTPAPVSDAADEDSRVVQAMEFFLEELETGRHPDRGDFLAKFPEIAMELAGQLEGLELLHGIAPRITSENSGPATIDDERLQPRVTLGDFRLLRVIGRGGMGVVYEAEQLSLGRTVAVKVLPFAAVLDDQQLKRFRNEARAAATLDHPNIVPVYFVGQERGVHFYAMQLIEGQSLAEVIEDLRADRDATGSDGEVETRRVGERETAKAAITTARSTNGREFFKSVAALGMQAATALEHAHQLGIVHRDIKPGNLLVDTRGKLWVTDFGLACFEHGENLTRTGGIVGTAAYMSPEQAVGSRMVDPRSDIYSLGATLYELLLLRRPHADASTKSRLELVVRRDVTSLRRTDSRIPADLNTILLKALSPEPLDRYQTAQAMADDLCRFFEGRTVKARRLSLVERGNRWLWHHRSVAMALFLTASLLVAAIVAALAVYSKEVAKRAKEVEAALEEKKLALSAAETARKAADEQRRIAQQHLERAVASELRARRVNYRSDMQRAFEQWHGTALHEVARLVARQVPKTDESDVRGIEWDVLNAELQAKLHVLGQHEGRATECVLFPDQETIASVGEDGIVNVWDLNSKSKLRSFDAGIGPIHSLAISPDGKTLAVGGKPSLETLDLARVYLLDSTTGERLDALQRHTTTIESIEFSPDGKYIAAGARYAGVQVSTVDGEYHYALPGKRRNESIAFSADSSLLATIIVQDNGKFAIQTWSAESGEPQQRIEHERVIGVAWSPRQATIAVFDGFDARCIVRDPHLPSKPLAFLKQSEPAARRLSDIEFIAEGSQIVAADVLGRVHRWEQGGSQWKEESLGSLTVFSGKINAVAMASDGRITAACDDGSVRLVTPTGSGQQSVFLPGHSMPAFAMNADGRRCCSRDEEGVIRTSELAGEPPKRLRQLGKQIDCIAMSPDGKHIVAVYSYGQVELLDANTGETTWKHPCESSATFADTRPFQAIFSPEGSALAVTGPDDVLRVWSTKEGKLLLEKPKQNVYSMAFSPDGKQLAYGGLFETVDLLAVRSGEFLRSIPGGDRTLTLQFSPNGRYLASGHTDWGVRVFDLREGRERLLRGHRFEVMCVTFSADGNSIISLDGGREHDSLRVWDTETGEAYGAISSGLPTSAAPYNHRLIATESRLVVYDAGSEAAELHCWSLSH